CAICPDPYYAMDYW
nr:immunoglobulin heavy chain junction region [Mus musculus]